MDPLYFTKVTQYGAGQLAAATANKTTINITQMAVGDGSGSAVAPDDQQTQLVNEKYRGELNFLGSYENDPTLIIAELIIPEDAGGWTMREAGLYDSKGKLFAVANTPPNAKPLPDTGVTKTQVVRIVIKLQNSENIQLITDTSLVTATRDYVDAASAKGLAAWDWGDHRLAGYIKSYIDTQYSNGTGLNLSGTQFSIKYGNAAGTAAQGNDSRLSDARDWSASVVSQAEAEAGTHTTARKWSSQRVRQATIAFFNTVTSSFTRTILSRANAALVRNDLQLGNAATHNYGAAASTIAQGNDSRLNDNVKTYGYQAIDGLKEFSSEVYIEGIRVGRGLGGIDTNTAVGSGALSSNIYGYQNTGVGINSLRASEGGSFNTSLGAYSMRSIEHGSKNTAVGDDALGNTTWAEKCTAVGASALKFTSHENSSGLGYGSSVTASNQVQLGDHDTTTYVYGTVQNRSDIRDKTEVRDTTLGLNFILQLRPVDYKWDMRESYKPAEPIEADYKTLSAYKKAHIKWLESIKLANIQTDGSKARNRFHHGFIAQEVKALIDNAGSDFGGFQDHSIKGGDDVQSLGYDEFIAPLVKSVQELKAEIDQLKSDNIHPSL